MVVRIAILYLEGRDLMMLVSRAERSVSDRSVGHLNLGAFVGKGPLPRGLKPVFVLITAHSQ